ncbi:MAG TPA: protein kinase, partial [Gemmataceae bacterium]|nr:protein kinase [Gemmataceae bacterium]
VAFRPNRKQDTSARQEIAIMPTDSLRKENLRSYIGRYRLQSHIATGGMGIVYKARDEESHQNVALKILLPGLAQNPTTLERFRQEAVRFAKLRHENIVRLYEFGQANGIHFLALEYVDGIDLHEYISRKGQLDPEEASLVLTQAIRALAYLHQQQIVHRDVKPSNFLVTRKQNWPVIKLTDLGLAREMGDDEIRLTRAGFMVGTIDYMAPEQARDSRMADRRSDIYSLGCTLYHMVAGRPPFSEGSLPERLLQRLDQAPPDVRQFNPQLSADLAKMLDHMLAKNPEDRYQATEEILADLNRVTLGRTPFRVAVRDPEDVVSDAETARQSIPLDRHDLPGINSRHQRAALGQFERANQVIAVHNYDYAIHLLLSACKLDPANLVYRQFLRRLEKALFQNGRRNTRLAWWKTLPAKVLLESAWKAKNFVRVIEYGERILVRNPWDRRTQIIMSEAADALGLTNLAMWILEQAWQKETHTPALNRALARLYEKRGHLPQAIALWKLMLREDPEDGEAQWQLNNLGAKETLVRGQYERMVAGRPVEVA